MSSVIIYFITSIKCNTQVLMDGQLMGGLRAAYGRAAYGRLFVIMYYNIRIMINIEYNAQVLMDGQLPVAADKSAVVVVQRYASKVIFLSLFYCCYYYDDDVNVSSQREGERAQMDMRRGE
jgi:hypothetical protein